MARIMGLDLSETILRGPEHIQAVKCRIWQAFWQVCNLDHARTVQINGDKWTKPARLSCNILQTSPGRRSCAKIRVNQTTVIREVEMENQENSRPAWKTIIIVFGVLFFVFFVIKSCASSADTVSTPKPTLDTNKNSYAMLYDSKDFATYPANYKDHKIAFKCEVFNIVDTSQFQCWTLDNSDPIGVLANSTFSGLYEDDVITVYGIGGGEYCGKNAFGARVCAPLIKNAWWTKP